MDWFKTFGIILMLSPFFLIATVLIVALWAQYLIKKDIKRLATECCPNCQKPFGLETIKNARPSQDAPKNFLRSRRKIIQRKIICPVCQSEFLIDSHYKII